MSALKVRDQDKICPASNCCCVYCDNLVLQSWRSRNAHNLLHSTIALTIQNACFVFLRQHFLFCQERSFYPKQFAAQLSMHSKRDEEYLMTKRFLHFVSISHQLRLECRK